MRKAGTISIIVIVLALVATPVYPVAKEIIQIQTAVARLEADLRDMRSSLDERMGMLRQLVEQSSTTMSRLNVAIEGMQRAIQGTVTAQGTKVDQMFTNVQGVHDSLEDVRARLGKLSDQMAQLRGAVEAMQAPPPPAPSAVTGPPPSPEALYQTALRDLQGGNLDLAMKEFQEYLRAYPETELAGNAQFYLGEILARQGQLKEAVDAYDVVLERYPRGNKTAAAHLKKGFTLIQLNQRDAGSRELRELVRRFPSTEEAKLARERLKLMGDGASRAPATKRR